MNSFKVECHSTGIGFDGNYFDNLVFQGIFPIKKGKLNKTFNGYEIYVKDIVWDHIIFDLVYRGDFDTTMIVKPGETKQYTQYGDDMQTVIKISMDK